MNNVGGDIAEKVLNEVLGDNDVKLLDTDNKSYGDGVPCWKTETFTTQGPCLACDKIAMVCTACSVEVCKVCFFVFF